ncbi:MAG: hypothetical protein LBU66_03205 [Treponema sp.]|jgi:hypothetical protein|nr:hypothetical protein [Treponema sp.]
MILVVDCDDGIIKIGSPPEEMPGIVESIKINDSLLIEQTGVEGRSGKTKIIQGWDDCSLLITLSLIDNPGAGKTRWDYLKQITGIFKKVSQNGKPEVYTLSHPMTNAWGATRVLFSSLETAESRTRRKITASLEFVEYDSAAGVIQERQEAETQARKSKPAPAQTPIVSDQRQRGLGALENRYANK